MLGLAANYSLLMAVLAGAVLGGLGSWFAYRLWHWLYRYLLPARYLKPLFNKRGKTATSFARSVMRRTSTTG